VSCSPSRQIVSAVALLALGAAGCASAATPRTANPRPDPLTASPSPTPQPQIHLDLDLTSGVTVGPDCAVTGFTGVFPDAKGDQCYQAGLSATPAGLTLTSSSGQLANGDQQNALFDRFDASAGGWVIHASLAGPITVLTRDYQQIALWFGPDDKNFVKVEVEHGNSTGPKDPDPHLTMYWDEAGKAAPVGTVSLPALTTTKTLDFYLRGSSDHQITAAYSLDGGPITNDVGHAKTPVDAASWFSSTAMAGILVSNSGSGVPIKATFTRFKITTS
jgi:hypothetical protein